MSSNSASNHTCDETNWTPGTQLSDFVRHLYMYDCRLNWTPLSLTEIVNLHVICRTRNLEQIFSC